MNGTSVTGTNLTGSPSPILIPLPDRDFDPTETAIPWKAFTSRGWNVTFSTEQGKVPEADPNLLRGPIFGPLGAGAKAVAAYRQMSQDPAYLHPIPYAEIDADRHAAILLPGGHAGGMRQYLESTVLQHKVLGCYRRGRLIGAICHGMVVPARTIDSQTGRSILYGHHVTSLPPSLDRAGYWLSRLVGRPYVSYPCTVDEEVRACLAHPDDLSYGRSLRVPYVVWDGNLITARYWLDAELFAGRFAEAFEQRMNAGQRLATGG